MSNNRISYLNRTFDDYKESLKNFVKEYYPQIADDFDDASIGSWLIDLVAAVGDNLSYYIDKTYNETNIETATQSSSIYNIARSNGVKIPGPKGSMAEVKFSCIVPVAGDNSDSSLGMPDMGFAPIIKQGTKVSSRSQVFEVMEDIDFSEQFNKNGVSNREIIPVYDSNKQTTGYKITKTDVVTAGESKIYKQVLSTSDITPFMEIILPDTNVMNIESIIFKDGSNFKKDPTNNEFYTNKEIYSKDNVQIYRFFEVDSLTDQYRWGDDTSDAKTYTYGYNSQADSGETVTVACYSITKGKWTPITQKFITEFTDKGYLKITFGSGESAGQEEEKYENATDFSQYQISRMIRNNFLGKLPKAGWTMYVLYRVGGGAASNVAKGTINTISYLNATIGKMSYTCDSSKMQEVANVKNSLTVTNTTPSISGKDAPTIEEVKAMIKYHSAAQSRCVTIKDYEDRIMQMPPKYGSPFRCSAVEENNKVKIFMLGLDNQGKLSNVFPEMFIANISEYLSNYRMINDYVTIEGGEIIHLSFEANIFVDKNYNASDVAYDVIQTIKDYMDINNHKLGEDIFVGDLEKKINDLDGVLNLIELNIYNKYRDGNTNLNYSFSRIAQSVENDSVGKDKILLEETNYVLNSNVDSMFEILNPDEDIVVKMIAR